MSDKINLSNGIEHVKMFSTNIKPTQKCLTTKSYLIKVSENEKSKNYQTKMSNDWTSSDKNVIQSKKSLTISRSNPKTSSE